MAAAGTCAVFLTAAIVLLGVSEPQRAGRATQPLPARPVQATAQKPMSNADVLKMVKEGVSDPIIIGLIRKAPTKAFDTSVDAVIELKRAGVSEAIQVVMFGLEALAASPSKPEAPKPELTKPEPKSAETSELRPAPGIYIDQAGTGKPQLIPLEPTVISRVDTRGGWWLPFAKKTVVAIVSGGRSALRTNLQQPTFYFYFDATAGSFGASANPFSGWLASASSPNEFVLVQMYQDPVNAPVRREMDVGKFGTFGSQSGVDSQNVVQFKIERLRPGAYRVTPNEKLGPGEFCLFYAAGAASLFPGTTTGKIFDFGVDAPGKNP